MFFRTKTSGPRTYLQVVENRWEGGRSRQRVVATLGRLDQLQQSGQLDALLASGARLARSVLLLSEHAQGRLPSISIRHIGPALVFQRLWQQTGCQHVIQQLLKGRRFEFPLERAVFLTVLHRLFDPGSDRAADKWKDGLRDRGMRRSSTYITSTGRWAGSATTCHARSRPTRRRLLPAATRISSRRRSSPAGATCSLSSSWSSSTRPPSTSRDEGGETIGQRGHSKDHRPDLKQMIVGAVLDEPGAADLLRALARQHGRCHDAHPGRRSAPQPVRRHQGLHRGRPGHDQQGDDRGAGEGRARLAVHPGRPDAVAERGQGRGPGPGRSLSGRASRASDQRGPGAVEGQGGAGRGPSLHRLPQRRRGPQGCRRSRGDRGVAAGEAPQSARSRWSATRAIAATSAATGSDHFQIDEAKIEEEARYDGKWVLRTNTDLDAAEVALQYKRLWMVEAWFRSCKSLLQTRPIYHKCDETIRGHVFCSFLALVLRQELEARLASGWTRVRVGRRDPRPGPAADGGSRARRQAVPAAERGAGHLRHGLPRGRSRRAADGAAGRPRARRPGARSWCHAAHVNLQMPTLQEVAAVYCRRSVRPRSS